MFHFSMKKLKSTLNSSSPMPAIETKWLEANANLLMKDAKRLLS